MVRGRRPLPTALKTARGNPGKRKLNAEEPKYPEVKRTRIPAPPDTLDETGRQFWRATARQLATAGVLTTTDLTALHTCATLYSRWQDAERKIKGRLVVIVNGAKMPNPYLSIADRSMRTLMRHLIEFGMTPSSRSKLRVGGPPLSSPEDVVGEFLFGPGSKAG